MIARLLTSIFSTTLVAACSYTTDESLFTALPARDFSLIGSSPGPGATGVAIDTAVNLVMSDYPDPASSIFPTVNLRSGAVAFDIATRVDLVSQSIRLLPHARLMPQVSYTAEVQQGLRALSGRSLGRSQAILFTTGSDTGGAPPSPPPLSWSTDLAPLVAADCDDGSCLACQRCHSGTSPAGGLSLEEDQAVAALVGVGASEVPLPRVQAGDPAISYLLRKLLGTPGIRGTRMPPQGTVWGEAELRRASDWILGGAQP